MLYEAHKGVESECPENTLISFLTAARQGYDVVELDLNFTKDNRCVVLHDETINKTCRNADGSPISESIAVNTLTYGELLKFDAGIYKAAKFANEKVPLFSQVLELCEANGLAVKIDNKIQSLNEEQLEILFSICSNSRAQIGFTSNSIDFIKMLIEKMPECKIHYDGIVDEAHLLELRKLNINEKITVWMCVPSPKTSWVKIPVASEELCKQIKESFSLGLWIIDTPADFAKAVSYGGDIIETTGKIKPERKFNGFYDCHIHSEFSHDSKSKPADIKESAGKKGALGYCITDHCDVEYCESTDVLTNISLSAKSAEKCGCLSGVEIGEGTWFPDCADKAVALYNFDMIIGSVHAVRYGEYSMPFSRIDFSDFSDAETDGYLRAYFDEMLTLVKVGNFDVLAHLTCPLRYIMGKFGKNADITKYYGQISEILRIIICNGIALEVNTSCLGGGYDSLMPDEDILKIYKDLGGYLITLGSDAHVPENLLHDFGKAREALKALGFDNLYYYKNRIPIQCGL